MTQLKCRFVTWNEVVDMCRRLADRILEDGYTPEVMVGLARSGFVPSRLLSDLMGVPSLYALKVEHWLDTTGEHREDACIPCETFLPVAGKRVLVVDDIVDTGKSMNLAVKYLERFKPAQVKTAVMQYITSSEHVPDYYAVEVKDWVWFIYPWNVHEDLGNLAVRILRCAENPLTLEELLKAFKENFEVEPEPALLQEALKCLERRGRLTRTDGRWRLP